MQSIDPELLKVPTFMRRKRVRPKKRVHSMIALDRRQALRAPRAKTVAVHVKTARVRPKKRVVKKHVRAVRKKVVRPKARAVLRKVTRPRKPANKKNVKRTVIKRLKGKKQPVQVKSSARPAQIKTKAQSAKEKSYGVRLGSITHYYDQIKVAVIELKKPLTVGDTIRIVGGDRDFSQIVKSMQINREDIEKAKKGDDIGMKVAKETKEGDAVYKV